MTDDFPVPQVVKPDVDAAIESMKAFQSLKAKLLGQDDTIMISKKQYIKRSGWRKISLAFNIATEIVQVERTEQEGKFVVRVRARAKAPNGRVAEDLGVCDSSEFERGNLTPTLHNVESKAATRAINRAISDLVGGGEISAEEIIQGEEKSRQLAQTREASFEPKPATQKFHLIEWTARGAESPLPVDSGPVGFLKKAVAGIEKAHPGVAVAFNEAGGHLLDIRVSGADEKVIADVTGPLIWAASKVLDCPKEVIAVSVQEREDGKV